MVDQWSISVGQLRAALAGVPDDYQVVLDGADVDDTEIAQVSLDTLFPPVLDQPGLLVLTSGQVITSEYSYHPRLDAHLDLGGRQRWLNGEWKLER